MVNRHPHVFGDKKIKTVTEVNDQWEKIKEDEKIINDTGKLKQELNKSIPNIPALTHSIKIQKKLALIGFDWNASFEIINKIYEEIDEFVDEEDKNSDAGKLDELGDILFSVVNLARYAGVDPESALRSTNRKFIKRVIKMEELLNEDEKEIENANQKELNIAWEKIKRGQ